MGTNYYVTTNHCQHCNRSDRLHIGKSSHGWSFTFHGYRSLDLQSWDDWKKYLKDKTIVDEYDAVVSYSYFVTMIENYKSPDCITNGHRNLHHNDEGRKSGWFNPDTDWDDHYRYAFTSREFS